MKKRVGNESDVKEQIKAFRKAAREVGADEASEEQFQDALRTVAKAKPSEKVKKSIPKNRSHKG